MTALGWEAQGVLGTSTFVDGFTLVPTSPASMTANLTPGQIYQLENLEATTWSSLAVNTSSIVKQGLMQAIDPITFVAPTTTGYAQNFLVEVQYADLDTTPVLLPYYNASNPLQPYQGPSNSGVSQSTQRLGIAAVQVKAGVAALSGTQTTPSPDAGWTGIFVVTLTQGQTTITSGSISAYSPSSFIPVKLPGVPAGVLSGQWVYAAGSGTNTYTATLAVTAAYPFALTTGMEILVYFANANTTTTPTLNTNGVGAKTIVRQDGSAVAAGDVSGYTPLIWDGTYWRINGLSPSSMLITTAVTKVIGSTGADFADLNAALAWLSQFRITKSGSVTFQYQAGQFTYANTNVIIAHPDLQRVKVLGATMLAACPAPGAYSVTGSSSSARTTDSANNLATLRTKFATELHFTGGGGVAIQGPIGGFDALLLTGDGTGTGNYTGSLAGIGLGITNGPATICNSAGVATCGFQSGIYIRNASTIQGDPAAQTGGPLITSGNSGVGMYLTGEACLTCMAYSGVAVGAFSNGNMGLQIDGSSTLQGLNCGASHSRGNGLYGAYQPNAGTCLLASGAYISSNGSAGAVMGANSSFLAQGCNLTYNGSNGGLLCYNGPISVDLTSAFISNNNGWGIQVYGLSWVRATSATFASNTSGPVNSNDGSVVLVTGATGTSGSSPAVGTVGNGNALITT